MKYEGQSNNPVKFLNTLVPLVRSGQIKWLEQVYNGIESVGEAVIAVQTGSNTAKVMIKV
jgi:NADPH-dependent curcumin reductase CurA